MCHMWNRLDRFCGLRDSGGFVGWCGSVGEISLTGITRKITETVSIPTIGIGTGPACDGQVLVTNDLLGMASDYALKFVKAYANLNSIIRDAVSTFRDEVRQGQFPSAEHLYE